MSVLAVSASQVQRGDRFGDGTVVVGVRDKHDGTFAIVTKRGRSRHGVLHLYDADAPVTVLRLPRQRTEAVASPHAHTR